ncbi:MAG: tetratricopeptide repeat protein [Calditrichaeota bacterium]|nr:MAG: tetratricopeptide repeat protein [Calditrichota bacterium]
MGDFIFNDVIRSNQNSEYFLKTANSEYENRIISSFFRNGALINTQFKEYDKAVKGEQLLQQTRTFHDEKKAEVQSLLGLSQKMRDTDQVETKNLLGLAFLRRGMFEEAVQEFEEAAVLDKDNALIYNSLGRAYLGVDRVDEATKVLRMAIKLRSQFADVHNNLGLAYLKKGQCKRGVECFEKAVEINTYYAEAFYNLGLAFVLNAHKREDFNLSVNVYVKVMECMEKAIKINPAYRNENFDRAEALLRNKEFEQAFSEFEKGKRYVAPTTDFPFILDFYLRVLHNENKLKSGMVLRHIKQIEKNLKKYPNYADLYNHLGVAYVILSKIINNKASLQFDKALEINPEFIRAKRNQRLAEYDQKGIQLLFDAILK